jgi:hypothetical protein
MPRSSRLLANPRLSLIKFGDISPPSHNGDLSVGKAGLAPSGPKPTPIDSILSRVLLNLPFALLKQVLEHPSLSKNSGELSIENRYKMITEIVSEREARRLRAVDALRTSQDRNMRFYLERLENAAEPLKVEQIGDFQVNNMGFREEVFPGDVPYLAQNWVNKPSDSVSS